MSAVIGWSSAIGYLFLAGVMYQAFLKWRKTKCADCGNPGRRYTGSTCISMHEMPAALAASVWPATACMVGGVLFGEWFGNREKRHDAKEARAQAKHERKMAETEAETEKMRINIEFLKANGVNAGVDGL